MAMMVKTLAEKIKEMKLLRQRIDFLENKAEQDAIDNRFRAITFQMHQTVTALNSAKDLLGFQLSDDSMEGLHKILDNLKACVQSGATNKDNVAAAEKDIKDIQVSIKKEWSKHYIDLTVTTISTLRVIQGIDSQKVEKCLYGIYRGEKWTTNIYDLKTMHNSLLEASGLIESLGLDQNIIDFLKKMNSGKASLIDIDENVLHWLKQESLESRIKLSFSSTPVK